MELIEEGPAVTTCKHCAAEVPPGWRFCPTCGGALTIVCPSCGATPPPGRFCGICGAPLASDDETPSAAAGTAFDGPVVAERRVTSVLFGDLVGFTALASPVEADPQAAA